MWDKINARDTKFVKIILDHVIVYFSMNLCENIEATAVNISENIKTTPMNVSEKLKKTSSHYCIKCNKKTNNSLNVIE